MAKKTKRIELDTTGGGFFAFGFATNFDCLNIWNRRKYIEIIIGFLVIRIFLNKTNK